MVGAAACRRNSVLSIRERRLGDSMRLGAPGRVSRHFSMVGMLMIAGA